LTAIFPAGLWAAVDQVLRASDRSRRAQKLDVGQACPPQSSDFTLRFSIANCQFPVAGRLHFNRQLAMGH
jgi:hypothetical protein